MIEPRSHLHPSDIVSLKHTHTKTMLKQIVLKPIYTGVRIIYFYNIFLELYILQNLPILSFY